MKDDKIWYWILGIIAAYFVIRFAVGKYADWKEAHKTDE